MMSVNSQGTTSFSWRPSLGTASPPPITLLQHSLFPSSLTHLCLCHVIRAARPLPPLGDRRCGCIGVIISPHLSILAYLLKFLCSDIRFLLLTVPLVPPLPPVLLLPWRGPGYGLNMTAISLKRRESSLISTQQSLPPI